MLMAMFPETPVGASIDIQNQNSNFMVILDLLNKRARLPTLHSDNNLLFIAMYVNLKRSRSCQIFHKADKGRSMLISPAKISRLITSYK